MPFVYFLGLEVCYSTKHGIFAMTTITSIAAHTANAIVRPEAGRSGEIVAAQTAKGLFRRTRVLMERRVESGDYWNIQTYSSERGGKLELLLHVKADQPRQPVAWVGVFSLERRMLASLTVPISRDSLWFPRIGVSHPTWLEGDLDTAAELTLYLTDGLNYWHITIHDTDQYMSLSVESLDLPDITHIFGGVERARIHWNAHCQRHEVLITV